MSLKVSYTYTCDVCDCVIKEEKWDLAAHCPAQDTAIPQPKLHGMGFGNHMACQNCISIGQQAAIKEARRDS